MKTKQLGTCGLTVPILGFGAMRLPMEDGRQGYTSYRGADEEKSIQLIRHAIDSGVNYIDTAFNYLHGESEKILGKALQHGYREKAILATKSPIWMIKSPEDFDSLLAKQLGRLQTDYMDCYLLHSVLKKDWEGRILPNKVLDSLTKAKEDGRVKHIGFSFHDNMDLFKEVANALPWDFCQIQLNYLDKEFQGGMAAAKYAAEKGMGVIVMEPLRGGHLANVPPRVAEVFDATDATKSYPQWAFDYVWSIPEVSMVLSGMGDCAQVDENVRYAEALPEGGLSPEDMAIYEKASQAFASYDTIPCTGCNYCAVCPEGVTIPYNFQTYNQYIMSGDRERALWEYNTTVPLNGSQASACTGCGTCEERCPQHIKISDWMEKVTDTFEPTV